MLNMTLGQLIGQKSYEKIERTIRRHPITFIPYLLLFFLLLIVPLGLYWLIINSSLIMLLQNPIYHVLFILLASIYYLSTILFFYTYFVSFHLDLWIITNDRILDMEQKSLFARTVSEVDLYQIQDATSSIEGFFPTIFNYGSINLQTAGPIARFVFRNVPHPNELRQTILDLAAEDKKFHENPPPAAV